MDTMDVSDITDITLEHRLHGCMCHSQNMVSWLWSSKYAALWGWPSLFMTNVLIMAPQDMKPMAHLQFDDVTITWLVVDLPLWKIWVRQLDDHSQYMENKSHVPNHPPVTHVCFPCQISRVYIYPKSLSYLPFPYFRGFHGPQDEKPMWFHEKWRVSKSPRLY